MSSRDRMEHTLLRIEKHMHEMLRLLEAQLVLLDQRIPPRPVVTRLSLHEGEPVSKLAPINAKVDTGQNGPPTQEIRPSGFSGSEFGGVIDVYLKRLHALVASEPGRRQLGQYLGFVPHPEADRAPGHALMHAFRHCGARSPDDMRLGHVHDKLAALLEALGFGK